MNTNFTGIWQANLAKSRFAGPHPQALLVKIKHSGSELQQAILSTNSDGSEQRALFHCSIDPGKCGNFSLNGTAIPGRVDWEGEALVIESWIQFKARQIHLRDYWHLSADGQTLIMEHRDDDLAGQITVLERLADNYHNPVP